MLSYRHAFHAGSHADVLKHYVLGRVLAYLNQKDKPYWYIDTHAGAGLYRLDEGYSLQNAEHQAGIARLWDRTDLPAGLADYVAQVRALNAEGGLRVYPGSPLVALGLLRPDDRLRLFELHSTDFPLLTTHLAAAGRRAKLFAADGFAGLKGLLPPQPKRALTLIDPSYEQKQDYARVVATLRDALWRFSTGVYMIWWPMLQRAESQSLPAELQALGAKKWLHVTLTVQRPRENGFGMFGSGLLVINPPWTLYDELAQTLPCLRDALAMDDGAGFELKQQTD